ncbi:hypothetical protein FISHEDRAFT_75030 [Fistulina hepatica ATCC 64428]|uniref:Uncharacterized protein n=1 Tax=Fistulina hepatica ATCC 64428 TaxID=1128425 RepID=A0A0D7A8L4_9AGAR|nr:hypothetical protein FISHEDRAFT_75030 [Fistulina hepatica ATCC 64428]
MDESVINILDSDDELPGFDETEVVGKGLKYPDKDVSKHIDHAKATKLKIPVSFEATLPSSDIPVPKFLMLPLPPLSKSTAYSRRAKHRSLEGPSFMTNLTLHPDGMMVYTSLTAELGDVMDAVKAFRARK